MMNIWKIATLVALLTPVTVTGDDRDSSLDSHEIVEYRMTVDGCTLVSPHDINYDKVRIVAFLESLRPDVTHPYEDRSFHVLRKFPNLQRVLFLGPTEPITKFTIEILESATKLESVGISNAQINPDALERVFQLPLVNLALQYMPVGDSIKRLETRRLETLVLDRVGLYDTGAQSISTASKLIYLDVSYNASLSSRFVEELEPMPRLENLRVAGDYQLSKRACRNLRRFPELKSLSAFDFNESGRKSLRKRNPNLQLTAEGSGFEAHAFRWGMESEWGISEQ